MSDSLLGCKKGKLSQITNHNNIIQKKVLKLTVGTVFGETPLDSKSNSVQYVAFSAHMFRFRQCLPVFLFGFQNNVFFSA